MAGDFDDFCNEEGAFPRYSTPSSKVGGLGGGRVRIRLSPPKISQRKSEAAPPADDGPVLAPAKKEEAPADALTFFEIVLKHEDGKPFAKEKFEVKLPDGTTRKGALGDDGKTRIEKIPAGECEISFPALEA